MNPRQNRFTHADWTQLSLLPGQLTERGRIGSVEFSRNEKGDVASLMPNWKGEALYGVGLARGSYDLIDSSDGMVLAEGTSLGEVLRVVAT